jgi:O-glycosyl hydrolase
VRKIRLPWGWADDLLQMPTISSKLCRCVYQMHRPPDRLKDHTQGWQSKGISIYAISVQNEPENTNDSYPTCKVSAAQEAAIATALRNLMDNNGFRNVSLPALARRNLNNPQTIIVGYDHNWSDAGGHPVQIIDATGNNNVFAGVAFHCYASTKTRFNVTRLILNIGRQCESTRHLPLQVSQ